MQADNAVRYFGRAKDLPGVKEMFNKGGKSGCAFNSLSDHSNYLFVLLDRHYLFMLLGLSLTMLHSIRPK